jgi:integrase
MVDRRSLGGEPKWKTCSNKKDAETYARQAWIERQNQGIEVFRTPQALKLEAMRCQERLKPHGITITQAVDYYLEHVARFADAPDVSAIVDSLIQDKKSANRRDATIDELKYRFGDFTNHFGARKLASVTLEELKDYFDDPSWGSRSRINYMTKISQLYHYAIKHDWCEVNLVTRVERPEVDDEEPVIVSVEQAAQLLKGADDHGLLPWAVLGLFGGIRPDEVGRLDWSAVKLPDRAIRIAGNVAKKRMRRIVPINDTLAAWLAICVRSSGPVRDVPNYDQRRQTLVKDSGISEWQADTLRHSFGSYHLAMYGDEIQTSVIMGNSVEVLHAHYKALVTRADAERYWALRPGGIEAK